MLEDRQPLSAVGRRTFLGGVIGTAAWATTTGIARADGTSDTEPERVANWDFRLGHADDLTGHDHDGTAGARASFAADGVVLDGTDAGEVTIPYATELQPEAAGVVDLGGLWTLRLGGVTPMTVGSEHRAVISGRSGNNGWIVYLTPTGSIEFWVKQSEGSAGYAKAISGVTAVVGASYDIEATWNGARLAIAVSGAASGTGESGVAGRIVPMGSNRPVRFGNGGSAGTEYFFHGSIATAELTVTRPRVSGDDAMFFGLWDGATQQWTVPSRLDFSVAASLAGVEAAVKAGDYSAAKLRLRDHFAARQARVPLPYSNNGVFRPGQERLFLDHIWTLGTGEIYQDIIEVDAADGAVDAEVTDAVVRATDGGAAEVSFFLMARTKDTASAVFHSRDAAGGRPMLEVTRADGSIVEIDAAADTYILAGAPTTPFGDAAELRVHDEGTGPYGPTTSKAYLSFPLTDIGSALPTSARLRLTGRTDAAEVKAVVVFQTLESFDEDTRTWATTVQNTFSWQGDPDGFDWRTPAGADREYGYQIPRFYFAGPIADVYRDSADEALASGLVGLMTDFVADADGYGTAYGAGSFPRSLDAAARVINWTYALEQLWASRSLGADALTAILRTLDKSGQYLAGVQSPTPNWMLTQKQALAAVAIHFPEFAASGQWLDNARDFLAGQLATVLHPDGGYAEATDGYAYGVAGTYAGLHAYFEANGHSLGSKQDLHRLVRFLADQTLPGGWGPGYGDSGTADRRPALREFAELLDDPALLHIATDGQQGTPPDHTSILYPDTKVAVLRTGWHPDASYLRINADNGPHSHPDNLAITVQADGRQLLPELGAFTYSSDPRSHWLRRTTEAQTTVEVDGTAQAINAETGLGAFATNMVFDLVQMWTAATEQVRHTRTVLSIRGGYWIVSDRLRPDDGQQHSYRQNWHFLPDARPTVDAAGATSSGFVDGANLLIVPAPDPGLTAEVREGYYSPRFYSIADTQYVCYARTAGLAALDTVLVPTAGATEPTVTVERTSVTGAGRADASALRVDLGGGRTATYCLSHIGPGHRLGFGPYGFDGLLAHVERDRTESMWLLHGGRTFTVDGGVVVSSPTDLPDLAVRLDPARRLVQIDGSALVASTDPSRAIRLRVPWASTVRLNGQPVPFTRVREMVLAARVAD